MACDAKEKFCGRLRFWSDAVLLESQHSSEMIDLSGPAIDELLDEALNYEMVSVLGHRGQRSIDGDPNGSIRVNTLIVLKLVPHSDIRTLAFSISESAESGTPFDNWIIAEDRLLRSG